MKQHIKISKLLFISKQAFIHLIYEKKSDLNFENIFQSCINFISNHINSDLIISISDLIKNQISSYFYTYEPMALIPLLSFKMSFM